MTNVHTFRAAYKCQRFSTICLFFLLSFSPSLFCSKPNARVLTNDTKITVTISKVQYFSGDKCSITVNYLYFPFLVVPWRSLVRCISFP